jgi:hypothetical protein
LSSNSQHPKSEIDFLQTSMSCYFSLKKQPKDQEYMSLSFTVARPPILMTMIHHQHGLSAHRSLLRR